MKTKRSNTLFSQAKKVIPGGVNSPVRAFRSVGGNPRFIKSAKGSRITDVDGNTYIDYIGSWGPMLLGHAHPAIVKAVATAAKGGTSYGAPTELEVRMAELIGTIMPSIEMVRMVNSGTEATMSAIRLARAYTGRDKVVKFEGCYHGHGDSFLIKAGSGAMTFGVPDSPGIPKSLAAETLTAQYNDLASVERLVKAHKGKIAALIVEPVVGNMGCVPPRPGFLQGLRALCTREKIVFIMDEVMTGFRVAPGGAQELYRVTPDLTTLGKIIGGGLPVGAYGGKKELMSMVSPSGPMYQAGTLSGNPLAMAAGYAMLTMLRRKRAVYASLEDRAGALEEGLRAAFMAQGFRFQINRVGSMFTLFFTGTPVTDFATASTSDTAMFGRYFQAMLARGIYLPPSQYEAAFLSSAHTAADVRATVDAARQAFREIARRR
jgi:glutamate-1-semialdehyde 2,1-aminomutase